jgi:dihydroorotate dehydrogenase
VKLPPEGAEGKRLTPDALSDLVRPLLAPGVCDGFVTCNTSVSLARELVPRPDGEAPGGISGAPLLPLAREAMEALTEAAPNHLRIGVGGILDGDGAVALRDAGAHLVELYSGLIYRGPRLVQECALALRGEDEATRR